MYCQNHEYVVPLSDILYLQFSQGEATSGSNTAVVLDSWASHNRSQLVNWSWGDGCRLRKTGIATSQLSAGLKIVSLAFQCCSYIILPGRSEPGLVAANPFGNLLPVSTMPAPKIATKHTVMGDLLVVLDRHCVEMRSRIRGRGREG